MLQNNNALAQDEHPRKWKSTTISMLSSWDYGALDNELEKLRLEALNLQPMESTIKRKIYLKN
jgi:hypothetical protein